MTGRMKKKLMYFKPFPVCGNYGMEIRGIHGNFQNSGFHGYSIDRHGIWKNMTEKIKKKTIHVFKNRYQHR